MLQLATPSPPLPLISAIGGDHHMHSLALEGCSKAFDLVRLISYPTLCSIFYLINSNVTPIALSHFGRFFVFFAQSYKKDSYT